MDKGCIIEVSSLNVSAVTSIRIELLLWFYHFPQENANISPISKMIIATLVRDLACLYYIYRPHYMFRLYSHLQVCYKYKNTKNSYNLTDPLIRNVSK
jgi:hypothetical protein